MVEDGRISTIWEDLVRRIEKKKKIQKSQNSESVPQRPALGIINAGLFNAANLYDKDKL